MDEMQNCRDANSDRAEKAWPIGAGGSFADIALRLSTEVDHVKDMTWGLLKKAGLAETYEEFQNMACKVCLVFDRG